MDTSQLRTEFESYYQGVLKPKFAALEKERKKYLFYFFLGMTIIFIIIPLLIIVASTMFWLQIKDFPFDIITFILSTLLIIAAIPLKRFKKKIKQEVMPEFIKYFGSFTCHYQSYISDDILQKSRLFNAYNRHCGDDYFRGTFNETEVIISEENLKMESGTGKRHTVSTVFQGIVILLSLNKKFSGQTIVYTDWGIFNFFHRLGSITGKLEKITLEDCIFEKSFEVYGTNQTEARYLLTTAFMEKILSVKKIFKGKRIQFSFFDNKLLIAVQTGKDMFETSSIFHTAADRRLINEAFEQFMTVFEIINTLSPTPCFSAIS